MTDYTELIENEILSYLPKEKLTQQKLIDSMEYSLKAGGKRLRPTLVILFAKACGGKDTDALPFAAAVEMIHTYSLIHDDLPCMDDDGLRRGKPSNHIVFGEDIALLAGDALLTLAFSAVLSKKAVSLVGWERAAKCGRILSDCAGLNGMAGGQVIDLISEGKDVSPAVIEEMHRKKTSALIEGACMMGAAAAGGDDNALELARQYGLNLGLAFQIMDDILDVTSNQDTLGKPIGSDADNNKSTFVTLFGLAKCRQLVKKYTDIALDALGGLKGNSGELKEIALKMSERKN